MARRGAPFGVDAAVTTSGVDSALSRQAQHQGGGGAVVACPPRQTRSSRCRRSDAAERAHRVTTMRRGLGKMGFVEGRNAASDYRWAAGQFDRGAGDCGRSPQPQCRGHHLGAAATSPPGQAAMAATQTIPIVFATAGNPVQLGFVASLNRPAGSPQASPRRGHEFGPKRMELLRELPSQPMLPRRQRGLVLSRRPIA